MCGSMVVTTVSTQAELAEDRGGDHGCKDQELSGYGLRCIPDQPCGAAMNDAPAEQPTSASVAVQADADIWLTM